MSVNFSYTYPFLWQVFLKSPNPVLFTEQESYLESKLISLHIGKVNGVELRYLVSDQVASWEKKALEKRSGLTFCIQ